MLNMNTVIAMTDAKHIDLLKTVQFLDLPESCMLQFYSLSCTVHTVALRSPFT